MLKKRIIATLIIKNGIVVQSIGFNKYLPIGKLKIAVEALNDWGIDELIILDIDASRENRTISSSLIRDVSKYAHIPISVGGGISTLDDIKDLLSNGADKICINHSFLTNPSFIKTAADIFGSQCIVVSLDVKKSGDRYFLYNYLDKSLGEEIQIAIKNAQEFGAGELLINSVDNDGKKCGYDLELINQACSLSHIPVIAQGGAKNSFDIEKAIKIKKLSAVAAANMFHFTEHSVIMTKSFLKTKKDYPIRLESHANYKEFKFDDNGRLIKQDDALLDSLMFEVHEKEII